jgi:hypothetical protein
MIHNIKFDVVVHMVVSGNLMLGHFLHQILRKPKISIIIRMLCSSSSKDSLMQMFVLSAKDFKLLIFENRQQFLGITSFSFQHLFE